MPLKQNFDNLLNKLLRRLSSQPKKEQDPWDGAIDAYRLLSGLLLIAKKLKIHIDEDSFWPLFSPSIAVNTPMSSAAEANENAASIISDNALINMNVPQGHTMIQIGEPHTLTVPSKRQLTQSQTQLIPFDPYANKENEPPSLTDGAAGDASNLSTKISSSNDVSGNEGEDSSATSERPAKRAKRKKRPARSACHLPPDCKAILNIAYEHLRILLITRKLWAKGRALDDLAMQAWENACDELGLPY
ncbi:hypothetical protein OBBRIDRAFT_839274 [Obba rivulosa]|uniref:Uncharacterized protein n=1 Tax=Obba rivulosa TaxID=1052685 RepID=A0A8E2ANF3_9APHY|nr:hypothetical protein OBBRIDRAFT_839274 [Obba rivulosa]